MAFALRRIRNPKRQKGQTLVEVTLIVPLLILLVGAALDWGLLFFTSHVVQNGVRQAARIAVTLNSPISQSTIKNEIRNVIPDAGLFSAFRTDANITVSCVDAGAGSPPFLQVTSTGAFNFYFMRLIGLSTTTITRTATMKYERNLEDCPTLT